jgi:predicted nuclease with TOPRIM domain
MDACMEVKMYRSPRYKLVQFFERSRDNWKRKCQDRIVRMKRLASRLEKMRSGRDRWRQRAQSLEDELARVQDELQQLKPCG